MKMHKPSPEHPPQAQAGPGGKSPDGLPALVGDLGAALQEEHDVLTRLCALFEQQLEALRRRDRDVLEQAAQQASEALAQLAGLRQQCTRKMRLLARVLGLPAAEPALLPLAAALKEQAGPSLEADLLDLRTRIQAKAEEMQARCKELVFALQYAIDLGRELIQALQGLDLPPPSRVYTAEGGAAHAAAPSSFVNKLG